MSDEHAPMSPWAGSIPSFALWKRALTPDEIARLAAMKTLELSAYQRAILSIPGLVRFWVAAENPDGAQE